MSTLSGHGVHTLSFAVGIGPSSPLRIRGRPQAAGTGTRVWRSARLAIWACETKWGGLCVSGRRVLELGCGTAVVGLACAALGAEAVCLTDMDEDALSLALSNARLNGLSQASIARLDITSAEAVDRFEAEGGMAGGPFDVVLVSDILCDPTAASDAPLARRIACSLCGTRPARTCHSPHVPQPSRTASFTRARRPRSYDFVEPAALLRTVSRLLAHSADARALIVMDRDQSRSEKAQRSVEAFASLTQHPAGGAAALEGAPLRCVLSEECRERGASPSDGGERGGESCELLMQLLAPL